MRTTIGHRLLGAGAVCLAAHAAPAAAQYVTPASYTATPGETGTYNYFDDTGRQLTDGVLGVNYWGADLGNGPAYEWVGWRRAAPHLVFAFDAPVAISRVQIGFGRTEGVLVYLPSSVTVGGTAFALTGTELPDGTRGFLNFDGAFSGSTLTIDMDDGDPNRWIYVDEVRFVRASPQVVPEPATDALLAAGLAGVGMVVRRRRWTATA